MTLLARPGSQRAWLRMRAALGVRLRLIAMTLSGLFLLHYLRGDVLGSGYITLDKALSQHGLVAGAREARAVAAQRRGRERQRVVFRAHERGEEARDLGDVWIAEAVLSRDGRIADLGSLHNLTRTSSADETSPVLLGRWALYARRIEGEVVAIELVDLTGEPPTRQGVLARAQRGISNLQQTGSWAGVGKRSYTLKAPAKQFDVQREQRAFVVQADGDRLVIDPSRERPVEGGALIEVRTHATVVAELVPWLVDTVREIPWIGAEKIAWLENKVFALRDRAKQAYHSVNTVDHAAEAAAELGVVKQPPAEVAKVERLAVPDPESGWPPRALEPLLTTPEVPGEGAWRAIVDDPHARELPNGGPVFYQTFLRADLERDWARVYLTVWDPRVVQLHVVAGTEEPVSATGETGTGAIPRAPDTVTRLVGAFNGGFQAMHGEFGMMADGRVYLPPKPWAATVAVFQDGRVGMGSWPGPSDRRAGYDEARAVAEIPAGIVAFRQNLTSLVEDGKVNPWGRWWWGAAPRQQSEQTLTQRSALCFTHEGFMIYAWGDSASPEALGAALVAARCVRALHLDMNAGHSGMELYNVLGPDEPREDAGKSTPFRFEGTLPELPGYTLRARKAVTSMGMALPRYIYPDPRDYFYLTLKPGIEGSPLPAGAPSFSSADLPHAGWPPAFARHAGATVRLLRIDPARALPSLTPPVGGEVVLAELRGQLGEPRLEDPALFSVPAPIGRRFEVGVPPQAADVFLRGALLGAALAAQSAIGVDPSGLLVYAETDDPQPGVLFDAMTKAGVRAALALPTAVRLGLAFREGVLTVDGSVRVRELDVALRFVASSAPAVELLFPDNTPMPYVKWAGLQDQRVRYFRTSEPTSKAPVGVLSQETR